MRFLSCTLLLFSVLLISCQSEDAAELERPAESVAAPVPAVHFVDVTAVAGLDFRHRSGSHIKNHIVEAKGGGGALLDYDGDGFLDVYLVSGAQPDRRQTDAEVPRNALFRNSGDGTFVDVTARSGVGDTGWGMGCAAGDIDDDGDVDIYVTNYGRNVLYRNDGDGTFTDISVRSGVDLEGWSSGASFGDYDRDGDLDLYVARYLNFTPGVAPPRGGMWKGTLVFAGPMGLEGAADALYRNDGRGRFVDVSRQTGVAVEQPQYGLGVLFADYDGDGDADILVANDSAPNFLFENQGDGTFVDVGLRAGVAFGGEGIVQASMGIAYGDYDGDGWMDFLLTHFEDDYNTLYHNRGDGSFAVASAEAGLYEPSLSRLSFGTCFLDYDNDGDQDLVVANGHVYPQMKHVQAGKYAEPNQLFVNLGREDGYRFVDSPAGDLDVPNVSRGVSKGDIDNDGDVDLLIVNLDGVPCLLRNDGGNGGNWLMVRLVGRESNREGVGARVRVVAGDLEQVVEVTGGGSFLSHSDSRAHFGLGARSGVEHVEVRWPSGKSQQIRGVKVNQILVVEEP